MTLNSTKYTVSMERKIRRAARAAGLITTRNGSTVFEHGQWWIENVYTGAQWSVCDASGPGSIDGFSFEVVTEGR